MYSEKTILLALLALAATTHANVPEGQFACMKDGIKEKCIDSVASTYYGGEAFRDEVKCAATWGAFPRLNNETIPVITSHLQTSIEYLLASSNFKYWKRERPGLANYFSKLSDEHWEEAMSLLIHFAERGGTIKNEPFKISINAEKTQEENTENGQTETNGKVKGETFHLSELEALSRALDREKRLATNILHLSHLAIHAQDHKPHDMEFADFLADGLQKHSVLRIKHLANYVGIVGRIAREDNPNYALFKFDSEYLK